MQQTLHCPDILLDNSYGQYSPAEEIDTMLDILRPFEPHVVARLELETSNESDDWFAENVAEIVQEIMDYLVEHCPDWSYVGYVPDVSGMIAVMPDIEGARDDDDCQIVSDTSEADGTSPLVLHVNDHGNATLYHQKGDTLTQVWAVV